MFKLCLKRVFAGRRASLKKHVVRGTTEERKLQLPMSAQKLIFCRRGQDMWSGPAFLQHNSCCTALLVGYVGIRKTPKKNDDVFWIRPTRSSSNIIGSPKLSAVVFPKNLAVINVPSTWGLSIFECAHILYLCKPKLPAVAEEFKEVISLILDLF